MSEPAKRAIVGLALFRASIGALIVAVPWIVGNGLDAYGATEVGLGLSVVAAATMMHRAPWLRWLQATLAIALFFTPFAFGEEVGDRQIYCAVLLGHMLLITAIVTPGLFGQADPLPTGANDASRSATTPPSSASPPPL